VANVLEGYACRGVFRGFSQGPVRRGRTVFRILWRGNRYFELMLDSHQCTIQFPSLLPDADPSMGRELHAFLKSRHSESIPGHRRIDARKASIRCSKRRGGIAVSLTVKDGDYEYGTRKLIQVVNEVFLIFLSDGRYHDYVVKIFDLEPDAV
jgi:hypothetical protein